MTPELEPGWGAEVWLWGTKVAAVTQSTPDSVAYFEYDPKFLESGIQLSPLMMPLRAGVFSFPELSRASFHGLPGLLADSLPDKFGNALIDVWLAQQGRTPQQFSSIDRLCYVGTRGMGALEFKPHLLAHANRNDKVQVESIVELASQILAEKETVLTHLHDPEETKALQQILRIGTSAGGARAKALIAWNPMTNEIRTGQGNIPDGFEAWLLKLDGVSANRDKELADPMGFGRIEYAYSNMAKDAGIEMTACHLLEEGPRAHFMTKRFDRTDDGDRLHLQSLAGMAHFDFNMAGANSYEQALQITATLSNDQRQSEQLVRRMLFNVIARNQDDHVKNIAFLMNRRGQWRLSPAYDLTYSYNPNGAWTSRHQMSINGKRDHFAIEDFYRCAQTVGVNKAKVRSLMKDVLDAVTKWPEFAQDVGVSEALIYQISTQHRLHW